MPRSWNIKRIFRLESKERNGMSLDERLFYRSVKFFATKKNIQLFNYYSKQNVLEFKIFPHKISQIGETTLKVLSRTSVASCQKTWR